MEMDIKMRTRVQTETGKSESESKSMLESKLQSKMAVDHPHTVYSASSPPAQCQIDNNNNNNNNNNNLSVAWCAGVTGQTDRQLVKQLRMLPQAKAHVPCGKVTRQTSNFSAQEIEIATS